TVWRTHGDSGIRSDRRMRQGLRCGERKSSWRMTPAGRQGFHYRERAGVAKRTADGPRWRCRTGSRVLRNPDIESSSRRSWNEQLPCPVELRLTGRTEDAVVTDSGHAFGRDVLKKTVNELGGGERHTTDLLSFVVAV